MKYTFKEIKKGIKKWFPVYYSNLLIDLGILKGQTDYTKYIILGRSRTGSNFLRGLLNSHPNIVCKTEEYRTWDRKTFGEFNPVNHLEKKIFRKYWKKYKAVGFKLFYYHCSKPQNLKLWEYLQHDKTIKIIHITRDNMLKTYVSRLKAGITDKWSNTNNTKEEKKTFNINFEDAIKEFEWTLNWEKSIREYFNGFEILEIKYEDLESDTDNVMKKVLKFLDIPYLSLVPSTYKQRKEKLSESIENYEELKKKFEETQWFRFFED